MDAQCPISQHNTSGDCFGFHYFTNEETWVHMVNTLWQTSKPVIYFRPCGKEASQVQEVDCCSLLSETEGLMNQRYSDCGQTFPRLKLNGTLIVMLPVPAVWNYFFHGTLSLSTISTEFWLQEPLIQKKNVGVNDLEGLITHPQTRLLDQDSDCFPVLSQPGLILEVLWGHRQSGPLPEIVTGSV